MRRGFIFLFTLVAHAIGMCVVLRLLPIKDMSVQVTINTIGIGHTFGRIMTILFAVFGLITTAWRDVNWDGLLIRYAFFVGLGLISLFIHFTGLSVALTIATVLNGLALAILMSGVKKLVLGGVGRI